MPLINVMLKKKNTYVKSNERIQVEKLSHDHLGHLSYRRTYTRNDLYVKYSNLM